MTKEIRPLTGGPGCNPCSPVPVGAQEQIGEPCPRPELIELEPPLVHTLGKLPQDQRLLTFRPTQRSPGNSGSQSVVPITTDLREIKSLIRKTIKNCMPINLIT